MPPPPSYERRVEPLATQWRRFSWGSGEFDTARRAYTPAVEGVIRTPQHVVMVTLSGGAEHLEVDAECGHRYAGPERTGAVSYVPAHCRRTLKLRGVASQWGSIALNPATLESAAGADERSVPGDLLPAFTNLSDPLVTGMVAEFARLSAADALDETYCDAMSWALSQHLLARYGPRLADAQRRYKLPRWRLRRVAEYVESHLAEPLRVADLAAVAGLSPGFFHRAFRDTTGQTPLDFINARRVQRAMRELREGNASLASVALQAGFASASHFSRGFRRETGLTPSTYRSRNRGR